MNGQDFFLSDNQNCTIVYKSESIIDLLVIDDVLMDLRQLWKYRIKDVWECEWLVKN